MWKPGFEWVSGEDDIPLEDLVRNAVADLATISVVD
jgi:hypothetical protein